MILSNQVKCLTCNDIIFSAHRHHMVTCSCKGISVDGGMDYLRRVGNGPYEEQSITVEDDLYDAMTNQAEWCEDTGRNSLGYVCAIARGIRDSGYKIVPVDTEEA